MIITQFFRFKAITNFDSMQIVFFTDMCFFQRPIKMFLSGNLSSENLSKQKMYS